MSAATHPGALVDIAVIQVRGGRGGRGSSSLRQEAFVPRGGPDGGDGGSGGSVVAVATNELSSLSAFTRRRLWAAQHGTNGASSRKHGRRGADLELEVPVGTVVFDDATGEVLGDLEAPGSRLVLAQGGLGGRGNVHFASPVNRTPRVAEPGVPGEERMVHLELRLIADVGLVGLPNAGKSSLLTALTAARPRIAAYPFTTLDPELGVLEREDGTRMVLADMPGLIEGASMGVGLGLRFLRHIERTRVLLYVVDGSDPEPWADLETVRQEVRSYSAELSGRPALIAVNKVDLDEACRFRERSRAGADVLFVSALTGEGLDVLTQALAETLDTAPSAPQAQPDRARAIRLPEVRHRDPGFSVERQPWGFALSGRRIERLVERTDFESGAALDRFQVVLDRMGVSRALEMAGATPGDTVRIGDLEFEYQP